MNLSGRLLAAIASAAVAGVLIALIVRRRRWQAPLSIDIDDKRRAEFSDEERH